MQNTKQNQAGERTQEEYIDNSGRKWIRVWRTTMPGIQQLVWVIETTAD